MNRVIDYNLKENITSCTFVSVPTCTFVVVVNCTFVSVINCTFQSVTECTFEAVTRCTFEACCSLLGDDEKFIKFIETVLSPKYRKGEDDIFKYVLLINPYLEKEGYTLLLQDYDDEGFPIDKNQVNSTPQMYTS